MKTCLARVKLPQVIGRNVGQTSHSTIAFPSTNSLDDLTSKVVSLSVWERGGGGGGRRRCQLITAWMTNENSELHVIQQLK